MFELRQLEHFLAVVECGTVSKAGEKLNITQPALSRSLQNLEYELKTPLFSRSKNKVTLTKTGEFAADYARKILSQADEMVKEVRLFHKYHTKIIISSCAPCQLLFSLRDLVKETYGGVDCETLVEDEKTIERNLLEGKCSMGLFSRKVENKSFILFPLKTERLFAMISFDNPLSKEKSLTFSQINGEAVIPFPLKGYWNSLLEKKLPDSKLLYQSDIPSFDKVVHASSLISFESDFLQIGVAGHARIPISDEEASITYHLAIMKTSKEEFSLVTRRLEELESLSRQPNAPLPARSL